LKEVAAFSCSSNGRRQSSFAEATEDEKSRERKLEGDLIVSGWFMPERLI